MNRESISRKGYAAWGQADYICRSRQVSNRRKPVRDRQTTINVVINPLNAIRVGGQAGTVGHVQRLRISSESSI